MGVAQNNFQLNHYFISAWRRKHRISLFILLAVIGNMLSAVFFNFCYAIYQGRTIDAGVLDLSFLSFSTLGGLVIVAICMAAEIWTLGWENSSAKRILNPTTKSEITDIFYLFIVISNLAPVLGFLFSFGAGFWLSNLLMDNGPKLLSGHSALEMFGILLLLNPLIFYINHRLFHSRWLWEFHKVHHSAENLNLITAFRNHPIDYAVRSVLFTFPLAFVGANPIALIAYQILNGFYQLLVHSEMNWKWAWVGKYILIGPALHRIHHSSAPEGFNTNFGILLFWDWIFGTLRRGDGRGIVYGVDDPAFNTESGPVHDFVTVTAKGARCLVSPGN